MELRPASGDDMEKIAMILQQAMDPTKNMSEAEKAQLELLSIVQQSFDFDNTVLRRMADLSEGKAERDKAEIFASGVISALQSAGYISFPNRITQLSTLHTIAHWFKTYERYLEQGGV